MHIACMTAATLHPDNIPEMEAALAASGASVAEMCRRAGIAETTWGRWKRREVSPTFKTWGSVVCAFQGLTVPTVPAPEPATPKDDAA